MSNLVTAKQILLSYNVLDPNKDTKRHPAQEFQAYAYRLAHELNDLDHLKIYLRLAKTQDRGLLEQVYSFVADANLDNKGALFLWKLKQLREEIKLKKELNDFSYDFVRRRTKILRNLLSENICEKHDNEYLTSYTDLFHNLYKQIGLKKSQKNRGTRVLVIGASSRALISDLLQYNVEICGVDISNNITKILKSYVATFYPKTKCKLISKDFLQNNYLVSYFDLIIVNNFWKFVPKVVEENYLSQIKKILSPEGRVIINLKNSSIDQEIWNQFQLKGKNIYSFEKSERKETFEKLLGTASLVPVNVTEIGQQVFYEIGRRETGS
jgi:SAM-dependent methyltransferase